MRASLAIAIALITLARGGMVAHAGQADDESAIRSNLQRYLEAYKAKDGKALAALWSEEGEFISPLDGRRGRGRENIAAAYEAMFDSAGDIALEVTIDSLRFVTGEVAVEEGSATITVPGAEPEVSRYRAIHVKRDGEWQIDSVRESAPPGERKWPDPPQPPKLAPELEPLAWLLGSWTSAGGPDIDLHCRPAMGGTFLRRDFSIATDGGDRLEGVEVIAWDKAEKRIRSWVFDSSGGVGSASWSRGGESWSKKLSGSDGEGNPVYSVHTITKTGDGSYRWRAHSRESAGQLLPNADPVDLIRTGGN